MTAPFRARHYATRHVAAATHHLAAQAALQVLEAGGNAVDAGVAGGLVLNVVQGEFCHFAGVAPIIVWPADAAAPMVIAGVGPWPRRADAALFRATHGGRIPDGALRAVVPGAPDAWITALARFGTMSFAEVASQAIAHARDGFRATELFCEVVREYEAGFRSSGAAAVFLPQGRVPRPGELIRMADLAATLEALAAEERAAAHRGRLAGLRAARDMVYRGDLAARIAAFYAAEGGWLDRGDLGAFHVPVEPAASTRAFGMELHMCGPWSQGPVLGMALLNAEPLLGREGTLSEAAPIHALAEAYALAFADRHVAFGDPDFVEVPLATLLDPAYARSRAALVRPDRAFGDMPPAGVGRPAPRVAPAMSWTEPELDTAFLCTADRAGNLFAATPSDGCFATPMVPGTGLCPSMRGGQSWTDPAHPACLGPGRRPRLTTSPAMARLPDGRRIAFGTPGDDVQPQAMGQVLLRMVREGLGAQDAVEAPRFATMSFPRSSDPHEHFPGRLAAEARLAEPVRDTLSRLGHQLAPWAPWDWRAGAVCLALHDGRGGIEAAADPRRPSGVAAR